MWYRNKIQIMMNFIATKKTMPTYLDDLDKCRDFINHMKSCPDCQRQCAPNNIFSPNVTIIALVVVIGMLLLKIK